jgi:predicted enzyme related to lactoylglutathione lyase
VAFNYRYNPVHEQVRDLLAQGVVDDLDGHVDRLRAAGVTLRSEVVEGPGGRQVLVADPAGNLVEVFEPAG